MTCTLLDFGCHVAQVSFDLWHGFSPASKLLIVLGLLSIIGGSLWGFAKALHRLGGWPAVAGAGSVLLGLLLAILPKPRAKVGEDFNGGVTGPDAGGPFQFGVDRLKPKKNRPVVGDLFAKWRR